MKKSFIVVTVITLIFLVPLFSKHLYAQIKDVLATSSEKLKPEKSIKIVPFGNMQMDQNQFFRSMQQELDEMNSMFRSRRLSNVFGKSPFRSSKNTSMGDAEMKLVDDNLIVAIDLPGHSKATIDLRVKDNSLIITSERKSSNSESQDKFFRKEISYGSFSRIIAFPRKVLDDKITATYKDGVLTVIAPIDNEKIIDPNGLKIQVN